MARRRIAKPLQLKKLPGLGQAQKPLPFKTPVFDRPAPRQKELFPKMERARRGRMAYRAKEAEIIERAAERLERQEREDFEAYGEPSSVRCEPLRKKHGIKLVKCSNGHTRSYKAELPDGEQAGVVRVSIGHETNSVTWSHVEPGYRMEKVGTALYETAAAEACKENKVLASDETRSSFSEAFWRKQAGKNRAVCLVENERELDLEDFEPELSEVEEEHGEEIAEDLGYESVSEAFEDEPDAFYERLFRIQSDEAEMAMSEAGGGVQEDNYYSGPLDELRAMRDNGDISETRYDDMVARLPEPEYSADVGGDYWPCLKWGLSEALCKKKQIDLGKAKRPIGRKPRGIAGKGWTRKDERQYQGIKKSCLARKPRCTTKYIKGKRVRQCYSDCERVAAATVNKRRKAEGRTEKKRKRART